MGSKGKNSSKLKKEGGVGGGVGGGGGGGGGGGFGGETGSGSIRDNKVCSR